MILTGTEIAKQVKKDNIIITPFFENQVNPNSYNYRIGEEIICFNMVKGKKIARLVKIPKKGFVLRPHKVYLASTYETLGSKMYAMSLIGRSSLGRLGLFLQISANLGHTGSVHRWTLELMCAKPFRIYPNMIIGQISFWTNRGEIDQYYKRYSSFNCPKTSVMEKMQR